MEQGNEMWQVVLVGQSVNMDGYKKESDDGTLVIQKRDTCEKQYPFSNDRIAGGTSPRPVEFS